MRDIDLFKKYENMMYGLLDKYNLMKRKEDYIDLCYIGYTKAIKTFNGNKSTFGTYVYKCMEYELLTNFKKEKTNSRKLNNNLLSIEYEYENGSIENTLISDDNLQKDIIEQETLNELYKAIFKLNIKEQYIVLSSFNLIHTNKNICEACKKLEMSKATFYNLRNDALIKLKRLLEKNLV